MNKGPEIEEMPSSSAEVDDGRVIIFRTVRFRTVRFRTVRFRTVRE